MKGWKRAVAFALCAGIFAAAAFFPRDKETEKQDVRVVRVWNVDTFEGGKGSRTAFLASVARAAEAERERVYYLVLSYTAEGARAAMQEGTYPDILSFGIGLDCAAERALPLGRDFAGGETDECLAYPWCAGGYFLFSLDEDFTAEGKTAISCGGSNLVQVAAALAGVSGEEVPSLDAYSGFLSGKYRYLLGTQRDICRFASRGVAVGIQPLLAYNDLYQYISVLSSEKKEDCDAFVRVLLSDRTQERLSSIGMYPLADGTAEGYTASVFSSPQSLGELLSAARTGEEKNIVKFLKKI